MLVNDVLIVRSLAVFFLVSLLVSSQASAILPNDPINDDKDADGIIDSEDNCIFTSNSNQVDSDGNGIGDECDKPVELICPTGLVFEDNPETIEIPELCDVTAAGRTHKAIRLLESLGNPGGEHDNIINLLYHHTLIEEEVNGELEVYTVLWDNNQISLREGETEKYFDDLGEAVRLLELHGAEYGVEAEYNEVAEEIVNSVRLSTQMLVWMMEEIEEVDSWDLEENYENDYFENEIDQAGELGRLGDDALGVGDFSEALDLYEQSFTHLINTRNSIFAPVSYTITPEGGMFKSMDGLLEIEVPENAVSENFVFEIELMRLDDLMWNFTETPKKPSLLNYRLSGQIDFEKEVIVRFVTREGFSDLSEVANDVFYFFDEENGEIIYTKDLEVNDYSAWAAIDQIRDGVISGGHDIPWPETNNLEMGDGPLPVFLRQPWFSENKVDDDELGWVGCKTLYGFEDGQQVCGSHYNTLQRRGIGGDSNCHTDVTSQMLFTNVIVADSDEETLRKVISGTSHLSKAAGLLEYMYKFSQGGKVVLTRAGAFGLAAGIGIDVANAVYPDLYGVCVNELVPSGDCNSEAVGEKCVYDEYSMDAKDYECVEFSDEDFEYKKYRPLQGRSMASCELVQDYVVFDCRMLNGKVCGSNLLYQNENGCDMDQRNQILLHKLAQTPDPCTSDRLGLLPHICFDDFEELSPSEKDSTSVYIAGAICVVDEINPWGDFMSAVDVTCDGTNYYGCQLVQPPETVKYGYFDAYSYLDVFIGPEVYHTDLEGVKQDVEKENLGGDGEQFCEDDGNVCTTTVCEDEDGCPTCSHEWDYGIPGCGGSGGGKKERNYAQNIDGLNLIGPGEGVFCCF